MSEKKSNRLIREKSPYLLQHAHNPVDWYPWGEDAFAKARSEDKPVFLSIGYSTCHWCHVMERESFEDPGIADLLNERFVAIKVDREERPDIDGVYMSAVSAMTGSGGWPLSVFLTPEKKPFYGGTYFPPEARWGSPGFRELLLSIHNTWQGQRERVILAGDSLTEALHKHMQAASGASGDLDESVLETAVHQLEENYDATFGGFGQAPKFPMAHNLSFLLRYARRKRDEKCLEMVQFSLKQMANGGIYDHLGGGFHRYSTDAQWQVPHFEKMLYDQALLTRAYLEGYQYTHNEKFAQVARETLDYVLRDLQQPGGGFFSAEDADSVEPDAPASAGAHPEKKEGAFYLWTSAQIEQVLTKEDAQVFGDYYGIEQGGNARHDPHGEFTGKNIVQIVRSLDEVAEKGKMPVENLVGILSKAREKLLQTRVRRPRPHLDDKVLTDWNGLMIASLALAGNVLKEDKYLQSARQAADFILTKMQDSGRLLHRYRDGEAAILGTLDDYAFFIHGLLELYMNFLDIRYLQESVRLAKDMIRLFWDDRSTGGGGFFLTATDGEEMIVRQKEIYDGALPSGNSIAALDLVRLYHLTMDEEWRRRAQSVFGAFAEGISRYPSAYAQMLCALDFDLGPAREIVVAAPDAESGRTAVQRIAKTFFPSQVVAGRPADEAKAGDLASLIPFVKAQTMVNGQLTIYLCQGQTCRPPLTDMARLDDYLRERESVEPPSKGKGKR